MASTAVQLNAVRSGCMPKKKKVKLQEAHRARCRKGICLSPRRRTTHQKSEWIPDKLSNPDRVEGPPVLTGAGGENLKWENGSQDQMQIETNGKDQGEKRRWHRKENKTRASVMWSGQKIRIEDGVGDSGGC